ncbi:hypothetical protein FHS51_003016 [Sphingobium wenxiniae]|jgi:hypothetical protein|uniref:Uncharacterized protein DUF2474 n=1 Tax=Sphingobium wenxiniae (strain DSM 21828 / CGMCC 1.7748 / JZ-1) TaxID=595605 RepID=A0A562K7Y4_SPHWJ|nr:DUF2474 domain-containing protein [Sphingobium wenxiniae]MBB6192762.1 hypothetical protein [Sphingobium wenxiniae]TWH91353.1 uncharacterized protein DUF2474 [Sphingobium wenxiniae]
MNPDTTEPAGPGPRWKRLAWFVAIWAMSIGTLGVVAYGIRLILKP